MITGRMVTLVDGTEVDSASEAWRHETEARNIFKMGPLANRRAWLEHVEHRRGKAAADALRQTMGEIWEANQK